MFVSKPSFHTKTGHLKRKRKTSSTEKDTLRVKIFALGNYSRMPPSEEMLPQKDVQGILSCSSYLLYDLVHFSDGRVARPYLGLKELVSDSGFEIPAGACEFIVPKW